MIYCKREEGNFLWLILCMEGKNNVKRKLLGDDFSKGRVVVEIMEKREMIRINTRKEEIFLGMLV